MEQQQDLTGLVRAAVVRKRHLFRQFPDITDDDLMQEGLIAVAKAISTFDESKGRITTFVTLVADRAVLMALRARARQAKRDALQGGLYVGIAPDTPDEIDAGEALPLDEWLASIYQHCKHALNAPRHRRGRRFFNVAQAVAVGMLMEREGLSLRKCRELLLKRRDLAEAVRLRHVPSHGWFHDAAEVCTPFLRKSSARTLVGK